MGFEKNILTNHRENNLKNSRNFFEKGIDFIGKTRYNVELYETL